VRIPAQKSATASRGIGWRSASADSKRRYSAFFGTELEILLRAYDAQTLILFGGLTDVCIHYTAVDAHQHDYHVRVASDAVGGSSQAAHDAALAAIEYLQRDALACTDDLLDALELCVQTPRSGD
jgi:nicotinamidase-related amidase